MPDLQTVTRDARVIPFIDEGEGPVSLVLIPEHSLEGDALGAIAHYLAEEAGFRIIRIDEPADGDATVAERVADVMAVLDHVGLDDSWVGGHGPGGTVARAVAAEHTARVDGLLLLGAEDTDLPLAPGIPILVIQGTDDAVTPPANGERLQASAADRATVRTVSGDHLFPMSHPIETALFIEEYLDWD
ncbi:alpha/beta hydrolase [Microbacterium sp. ABRD28]|uniref:alpha/beta fold hydrolase n=1 Tax=Microbacterium sp. ABRD28 TaxID=2268461 RepID=UPI000F5546FA|nr:alpha/beta hydrolase [Microbacterium sp. ABRD28]AZC14312.1 alpha/beta hydrolase [Microbacterium sp. ABRD28]